jgi:hypothetical protein
VALSLAAEVRVRLTRRVFLDFALDGYASALRPGFDVLEPTGPTPTRDFARFGVGLGAGLAVQLR